MSSDYRFSQDVMDEVEIIVDRVGSLNFVKNILLFYMLDHGIQEGLVWDCVTQLSRSPHKSIQFKNNIDKLLDEYGEDSYPKVGLSPEKSKEAGINLLMIQCILDSLSEPLEELPYTICGLIVGPDWDFDRLHEGIIQMGLQK